MFVCFCNLPEYGVNNAVYEVKYRMKIDTYRRQKEVESEKKESLTYSQLSDSFNIIMLDNPMPIR